MAVCTVRGRPSLVGDQCNMAVGPFLLASLGWHRCRTMFVSLAKPRERVMLTRHHWVKNLHDAGYRPRWMKFPQELNGYLFKTKASHLDGGHRLWSGMERDGLRHATLLKTHHMKMTTTTQSIPDRSSPGTRTAPAVAGHQDRG